MSSTQNRLRSTLALDEPVSKVSSVSPTRAKALEGLGITTVRDLVTHFPRRYLDLSRIETIASAHIGEDCSIKGSVHSVVLKKPKPRLSLVEITIIDGTGTLIVTCFRQPWLADSIKPGITIAISGKVSFDFGFKRMTNPFIERIDDDALVGRIIPVHPACEKISAAWMRRLVINALKEAEGVLDPLPLELRRRYRLISRQHALRAIHFPQTNEELVAARRRLAFEELFFLQLLVMHDGLARERGKNPVAHVIDGPKRRSLQANLPFTLTDDQTHAVKDIACGMAEQRAMNHLLLGDVGTGKTIVAALACCMASDSQGQSVILAPTEVLASQHAKSLGALFDQAGMTWALLTGSTDAQTRKQILSDASSGQLDVLIGTHALLEPDVTFSSLTLVVIDEQQRFGVEQRAIILSKGEAPDALFLTATPIPRTLALALYGNLTLSYLRQKPHDTTKRKTHVVAKQDQGEAYEAMKEALARGEQGYIVCPLIDEAPAKKKDREDEDGYVYATISIEGDDDFDAVESVTGATRLAQRLQQTVFTDFTVGLLHGKLSSDKKAQVMDDFRAGKIDVLVSTTVIEVGVDVANATCMIIEDADRFGLSQLHQLRGRVGRGDLPGEVFLISGNTSDDAIKRLKAMETTEDGYELATYDLSLRREGDILGNRQHGVSSLKLVNVIQDADMISVVHEEAAKRIHEDPEFEREENQALWREIRMMFKTASVKQGG